MNKKWPPGSKILIAELKNLIQGYTEPFFILGFQNIRGVQEYRGFKYTCVPEYRMFKKKGLQNKRIHNTGGSRIQVFQNTGVPEYRAYRIQGSRKQWFKNTEGLEYRGP